MPNILDLQNLPTDPAWDRGNTGQCGSTASMHCCLKHQMDGFAG
ncbi:hypothetical protein C8J98_101738 [Luteibacter sp. OK325]|jgi:hypothetical protein|nr:hypothetical protein C8J98_101738 [Luteibacter sp. OK325]